MPATPAPARANGLASPEGAAGVDGLAPSELAMDPRALENHLGGSDAKNYRRYEFDLIAPWVGPTVLEVGAGLGEFGEYLRDNSPVVRKLVVSDTDPICLKALHERFDGVDNVTVATMDIDGSLDLDEPVDTVLAMNVLEHIEDDVQALKGLSRLVRSGGRVVLWVPASMKLYGDFDRMVGHHRRYTPDTLRPVVEAAGLTVEKLHWANLLGGVAWWAAVRRGGAGHADPKLVRIYDRTVVPTTRLLERRWKPPFGQSVLCVARVP
jgi:SAM-dependent methyltransferase